jgi:hypothetical protein
VIRGLLRALNGVWAWQWSLSGFGLFTRILDAIVDRFSPPLDRP